MDYPEDGFLFLQDMQWRTEIDKIASEIEISHKTKIITLGSCFSDTIGNEFLEAKFPVIINPFGVLFNPLSIARLFDEKKFTEEHYINSNSSFSHLDIHSSICHKNKDKLVGQISDLQTNFVSHINKVDVVFITLGTAFVYEFNKSKQVVANCHKLPSSQFTKRLLSVDEIVLCFSKVVEKYPDKKFVFTISPVRHTREGLSENMLSKSILRVAVGQLCELANVSYFPSYEVMMDDLRDYRYYTEDLIHINKQGQQYIWSILKEAYFSNETIQLIKEIEKVNQRVNHRPFDPQSDEYLKFLKKTMSELKKLNTNLDFEKEIGIIKSKMLLKK